MKENLVKEIKSLVCKHATGAVQLFSTDHMTKDAANVSCHCLSTSMLLFKWHPAILTRAFIGCRQNISLATPESHLYGYSRHAINQVCLSLIKTS